MSKAGARRGSPPALGLRLHQYRCRRLLVWPLWALTGLPLAKAGASSHPAFWGRIRPSHLQPLRLRKSFFLSFTFLEISLLGLHFVSLPLGLLKFLSLPWEALNGNQCPVSVSNSFQVERKGLSGPLSCLHRRSEPLSFEPTPFGTGCHPSVSSPLLKRSSVPTCLPRRSPTGSPWAEFGPTIVFCLADTVF